MKEIIWTGRLTQLSGLSHLPPPPSNQTLSQHKQEMVKLYLVTKHGWPWVRLSKERLPAAGFC